MRDLFLNILSHLKAWFVNLEIRYNSPTIIINMAKAIEDIDSAEIKGNVKKDIRVIGSIAGTETVLNKFLQDNKVT